VKLIARIESGEHDFTSLRYTSYDKCLQICAEGSENFGLLRMPHTVCNFFLNLSSFLEIILIEVVSVTSKLLTSIGRHPHLRCLTIVDCSSSNVHRDYDEIQTCSCLVDLYFKICLKLEVLGLHEDRLRDIDLSDQFVIELIGGCLVSMNEAVQDGTYVQHGQQNRKICISVKHRFSTMFFK
jgi:hypothetical protein